MGGRTAGGVWGVGLVRLLFLSTLTAAAKVITLLFVPGVSLESYEEGLEEDNIISF